MEKGRGVIEADRQRLTQAIMQLAQNAVQHTDEGSKIEIGSQINGGTARFWVTDEGSGIPEAERERVFQRFARARGIFRSSDGAGLGLSIVKVIAEGHHGEVSLESEVGKGSTFIITIPVDQPYVEAQT
ncbi:MAG: sensor histidine kinase [Actinomycetota bacterium]